MFVVSCKKDAQLSPASETLAAPKADKEFKKCDISRIISRDPFGGANTVTFAYNQKGDPVSVTPSHIGTGTPQWLFLYNKKGQLTDFIGLYEHGGFEFWHKYSYNNHNQIIVDSTYIFGIYAQGPTSGTFVTIRQFEYDVQGRISKETAQSLSFPPTVTNYTYDANGNKVRAGTSYDNQLSFLRTNALWMFLMRDYSRNNPLAADSYNSEGLPLEYNITPPPYYSFGSWPLIDATIEYNCKGNSN
jgi:hypothetical protein